MDSLKTSARPRLVIAGGGTGGHVLAGISIADQWRSSCGDGTGADYQQVLFIGAKGGHEERLVPRAGYPLVCLKIGGLNRVSLIRRLKTAVEIPLAFWRSMRELRKFRPIVVIGVGGFSAGPVVLMAHWLGIPTAILEQNSVSGFTNRLLSRWVDRIFLAFKAELSPEAQKKAMITGNPIRSQFSPLAPNPATGDLRVLVFGGSQGAIGMNTVVLEAIESLKATPEFSKIHWVHQTGNNDFARVSAAHKRMGTDAQVSVFIDDMAAEYQRADLVICRAGASTLSELSRVRRPAILVPLPTSADNHQEKNARVFESAGAALIVQQLNPEAARTLASHLLKALQDPQWIQLIAAKTAEFDRPDAAVQLVKGLMGLVPPPKKA